MKYTVTHIDLQTQTTHTCTVTANDKSEASYKAKLQLAGKNITWTKFVSAVSDTDCKKILTGGAS